LKKIIKIILINFSIFCTIFVTLELFFQIGYFLKHDNFLFVEYDLDINNDIFEIHPYLGARLKKSIAIEKNEIKITSTSFHTRWTGAPKNTDSLVRIAIFGGSTTFGTGVTDKDTWPALLQEKLGRKYAVMNYGIPGYSTAENIIQMSLVAPEKKPDIVIFYEGWNDIRNYHDKDLGSDYYSHGMQQYTNLGITIQHTRFDFFNNTFATFHLAVLIGRKVFKKITPKKDVSFTYADAFVDSIYKRNLETLKLLAKPNSYSIFIPQILNYESFLKNGESSFPWSKSIKNKSLPKLMGNFNNIMEGLCNVKDKKDCIVLNEVLELEWSDEDFVDNGHFSRKGGMKMAELTESNIIVISKNLR